MSALVYPSTLPPPQTGPVTGAERRLLAPLDGVRIDRMHQKARLATQECAWLFTYAEAAIFRDWWLTTLSYGGAWFSSSWPLPQGSGAALRRFLDEPKRTLVPGVGWRVAATVEVSGLIGGGSGGLITGGGASAPSSGSPIAAIRRLKMTVTFASLNQQTNLGVLQWTAFPGVTFYDVYRNGVYSFTTTAPGVASSGFNFAGLTVGQTYSYTVRPIGYAERYSTVPARATVVGTVNGQQTTQTDVKSACVAFWGGNTPGATYTGTMPSPTWGTECDRALASDGSYAGALVQTSSVFVDVGPPYPLPPS